MGVIVIMISSVWLAHFKLFSRQSTTIDSLGSAQNALQDIDNSIKQSNLAQTQCTRLYCEPNCYEIYGSSACSAMTSNSTHLILQYWPLDSNNNPIEPNPPTWYNDYILYFLEDDGQNNTPATYNLIKWVASVNNPPCGCTPSSRPDQVKTIATNVTGFTYDYLISGTPSTPEDSTEIQITLTLIPQGSIVQTDEFEKSITTPLRNKTN